MVYCGSVCLFYKFSCTVYYDYSVCPFCLSVVFWFVCNHVVYFNVECLQNFVLDGQETGG